MQITTIKALDNEHDCISIIVELLENQEYVKAQQEIKKLLQSHHSLLIYEDPEINAIRLELTAFEQKIQDLILQRNEAQNRINDFNREYQLNLGSILLKILTTQKELAAQQLKNELRCYQDLCSQLFDARAEVDKLQNAKNKLYREIIRLDITDHQYDDSWCAYTDLRQRINLLEDECEFIRQRAKAEFVNLESNDNFQQYRTAQENASNFEEEYDEVKNSVVAQLDKEGTKKLKSLYRKACRKCHPDIVSDELKDQAHTFMVEINAAYSSQDIERLEQILHELEYNNHLSTSSEKLTDKQALTTKLADLKERCQHIYNELSDIAQSEDYQTILDLGDNWDSFFDLKKQELEELAQSLESELEDIRISEVSAQDVDDLLRKMTE